MNTKVVVINGERINYDGSIDYNILSDHVVVYKDSTNEEVIERITDECGVEYNNAFLTREI